LAAWRFLQRRAVPSGREIADPATPADVECAIFDDGEFLQDSGNKVKLKNGVGVDVMAACVGGGKG
jgi:hypothetical protein